MCNTKAHFLPLFLGICGLAMLVSQCSLMQTIPPNLDELEPVMEMSKGPCYGNCPVFSVTIYSNRTAAYRGERFTQKPGVWVKTLTVADYDRLLQAFREANLWKYPNAFKSQLPDLQTVSIIFHEDGNTKEIRGKDGRPEVLIALESMMDRVASSTGWTQIEGEEPTDEGIDQPVSQSRDNEIIIEFSEGVDPNVWVIQFAKQKMRVVKRISPSQPYYLVSFDPNEAVPERMLNVIRRDPYVMSAEINKNVSGR